MEDKKTKKELVAQYKERTKVGGVYRIVNKQSGRMLLCSTTDMKGSKNRFDFSVMTGSCVNFKLQKDWNTLGADMFLFEVLEEYTQKETQTDEEFTEEIELLRQLWEEKLESKLFY